MRWACGIFLAAAVCSAPLLGAAPKSWDYAGDGQWRPTATVSTQPVTDETLDRAEGMIRLKQIKPARKVLVDWLKSHKTSPIRDRALLLMADALFRYGDRIRSFYYLDELLDTYPDSRFYGVALQKQYEIGDAYLNGYKRRLLYMPILDAEDEGIEMMYRIQTRSPGSPLAEKALLRTSDYYYADSQFDLAADAYAAYARNYPRSPLIPRIRLRQAFASLAQFRGVLFDPSPLIDARAQLTDLASAYPQLATEENVQAVIDRIDSTFARKLEATADFYVRTHRPEAAVYTYRYLAEAYPNSPEADRARTAINKFPPAVLNGPTPPPGSGYAPTTAPVEAR